jgi:uncharacterized protein (UPF0335 family)
MDDKWKPIDYTIARINARIEELEDWKGQIDIHVIANEHDDRLDKLEDWKRMTPDTALVRESASQFNQRITRLEKEDKLKDENLHSLYWQIKHLEELDIDRRLKGLFATLWYGSDHKGEALVHRVEDLEEWKRGIECVGKSGVLYDARGFKIIDKKVWEEIKRYVEYVIDHNDHGGKFSGSLYAKLNMLSDAIKKADPEWCKDDQG